MEAEAISSVGVAVLATADRVSRWPLATWALLLLLLMLSLCVGASSACPTGCDCQASGELVSCTGLISIPSTFSQPPKSLKITQHRITKLSKRSFTGLEQLELLEISGGRLSEISDDAFSSLRHLQLVNLSRNELALLPRDAFAACGRLLQLDLSLNPVVLPRQGPWLDSSSLVALDLSSCSLSNLPGEAFSRMPAVAELRLCDNHLQLVSMCALEPLERWILLDADPTVQWIECDPQGATTGGAHQPRAQHESDSGDTSGKRQPTDGVRNHSQIPLAFTPTLLVATLLVVAGVCLALGFVYIHKVCQRKELGERNEYMVLGGSQPLQLPALYFRDFRGNDKSANSCDILTYYKRDSLPDVESRHFQPGSVFQSEIPFK